MKCTISSSAVKLVFSIKTAIVTPPGGGGGLLYEEYKGVFHELGSYFQEKSPKRVCQFFIKIPEKGYNICKKFQIGSVILMT